LVSNDLQGYYQLNDDNQWLPFTNFTEVPHINLHDPHLKLIDLNGDGMADILISEDDVFTWYAAKGKEGFDTYKQLHKAIDEENGPLTLFANSNEAILLADMCGDGLMDIVRIRYSEVVYWPNLGYGRFGAKVSMSNAPVFANTEDFNPQYIKPADLDGSGTTDLVYIGQNSFQVYFNQSGNSFSDKSIVEGVNPIPFPHIDNYSQVNVIDLLGNGTGSIVWSSPLPQYTNTPLYYINLMGGKKPHVLTGYKNNTGAAVSIEYLPSTVFYLQDKQAGTPWVTRLPFPVQCVSKVVVTDDIRKTRFTSQYSYHHGYYDQPEREFRGFGRVDQTDTEDFEQFKKETTNNTTQLIEADFHQPPVLTKTWFHTGAFLDTEKILNQFAHEYYSNNVVPEKELTDPRLPATLTIEEWRQALRACKGIPLRAEVYSPDGSDQQQHPYTTTHYSCLVQLLQPQLQNQYGVFQVQQSESLAYSYDRNPADPRTSHSMTIETDAFGNVLQAATISYGRKTTDANLLPAEQAEQSKTHIVFVQNSFTNVIDTTSDYLLPKLYEAATCELTGLTAGTDGYFSIDNIESSFEQAQTIAYEVRPNTSITQKRLIEQVRSLFLKNDLSTPLAIGQIESLALPYQTYKLSLTPGLRDFIFGTKVTDSLLLTEGRYFHFNDGNYWIAGGTSTYDAEHFYQVIAMADPFGFITQIQYDNTYHFFVQQTTDALNNISKIVGFNYRTLSPYLLQDSNDNRSGVRTDELGMVTSSFVMGKEGENKGDFMDTNQTEASPNDQPTSTLEYDLFNYLNNGKPNFIKTTTRETHYFDSLQTTDPVKWQTSYGYADGTGQILMHKVQAEPGLALQENEDGTVSEVDTSPNIRWIGNGRTILNNKGKPVKQYEPYFSTTFEFEDNKQLVERGVTPIITYDAIGRVIRTDLPNGTFTKVAFEAWMQQSFDQNDTVLDSQWYKNRITAPVSTIATPEEIDAANKAAAHANTPAVAYLDSLGRAFVSIGDNGAAGKYKTTTDTDIEGNVIKITDARDNAVMQYKYDMLGAQLYHASMDAGERWVINDVMGKPMRSWDSRNNQYRYEYDSLHRSTKSFVSINSNPEINYAQTTYGEGITNDKQLNLRGKPYQQMDAAGIITHAAADFKGNSLQVKRQLCSDYKNDIDWNNNPVLESSIFNTSTVYDALNRTITLTSPDQSIITPTYNETNLLNKVDVQIKGVTQKTTFVKNIDYDAKGQRQSIVYGNNTATNYQYDPKTFRLKQLLTTGKNGTDVLQKLQYTYDPVGNITTVKDLAQQALFFNNTVVDPSGHFTYDAIYQLINASGREHIGQNKPPDASDANRTNLPMPGDGAALRNYAQTYQYDAVGNILQMIHAAGAGSWTRTYAYDTISNRLQSNTVGSTTETFTYDAQATY